MLPIEGPDVVLGIQWLQQLGRVSHYYSALTMEFFWDGHSVILKGDLTAESSLITLHQFPALLNTSEVHTLFTLEAISIAEPASEFPSTQPANIIFPSSLPVPITQLLQQFHSLFQSPSPVNHSNFTAITPHSCVEPMWDRISYCQSKPG